MQVTLNGQLRALKFNQLALEVFTKHTDYETTQGDLYACIYAGLKGQSYVKREPADYSFEEVCDWCDNADQKELVAAYNEFCETNQFKTWYAKFQDLISTKLEEADTEKKS
jgi:hypothetical protein